MSDSRPSLSDALRSLQPIAIGTGHPPLEVLWAYRSGSLDEEAKEEIQEHLATCPDCARALLDLDRFPDLEPTATEPGLSDEDQRQDLGKIRQVLEEEDQEATMWTTPRHSWLLPIAALLAVMVAGLLLRTSSLDARIKNLSRPQGRTPSTVLSFGGGTTRGDGSEHVVMTRKDQGLSLHLDGYDAEDHSYTAVFSTTDGKILEPRIRIEKTEAQELVIWFPVAPAEGSYQIELSGDSQPLRTYRFRVVLQ